GVTAPVTAMTLTAALGGETASASLVAAATSTVLLPVAGSAAHLIALEVLRMTAWKTPAAWAAAIVLTAGIGTGTGIMMAQTEQPGATPSASAPAVIQPPKRTAPPEVITPPAAVDTRQQREKRIV